LAPIHHGTHHRATHPTTLLLLLLLLLLALLLHLTTKTPTLKPNSDRKEISYDNNNKQKKQFADLPKTLLENRFILLVLTLSKDPLHMRSKKEKKLG
jgi:hypothetical protein